MPFLVKNAAGDIIDYTDFDDSHGAEFVKITDPRIKALRQAKDLAEWKTKSIADLEKEADSYQARVIGTGSLSRKDRFAVNLESAKAYVANSASADQTAMLQTQLDANITAQHPLIKDMTLLQFATWIADQERIVIMGSGLIEKVMIEGRAAIQNATSREQIELIKAGLRTQAETEFNNLVSGS